MDSTGRPDPRRGGAALERSVLVFDVNETLLDLRSLDPAFEEIFGTRLERGEWFTQLLRSAMAATLTERYRDFGVLGRAALAMVAARRGREVSSQDEDRILATMRRLPPHPEVPLALERLAEAGFRLAALTNSPPSMAREQIDQAGLARFFEQVLSVDAVRRFKPHPEVYLHAAQSLGIGIGRMRMVAAHDWDTTGALAAGARAAFIARPGMVLDPLAPRPDVIGSDLLEVADGILEAEPLRDP
ncbi:MAG: haloacid dehalogenase type II [Acidobacteria bacterium]|nr:haloacid dehalogenase type II [Acidobacteriota bacterium]